MLFARDVSDPQFAKRTFLLVRLPGEDVQKLDGFVADDAFDVAPEVLATEKAGHIGPCAIAKASEFERQPLGELVVLWIGVANENDLATGHRESMLARKCGVKRARLGVTYPVTASRTMR